MYMDNSGRIEQPEAVRKRSLTRSAGIIRVPCQAERILFDRIEQSRRLGAGGHIATTYIFQRQPEIPRLRATRRFPDKIQYSLEVLVTRLLAALFFAGKREHTDLICSQDPGAFHGLVE